MLAQILKIEEVRAIVERTNSFPKEVLVANRGLIRQVREEKKARLAAVSGSYVGALVDRAKAQGFVLTDVKEKGGVRTDTMTITLKRANQMTEEDRLKAKIAELTSALEKLTAVSA